jgi:hypothetical protein
MQLSQSENLICKMANYRQGVYDQIAQLRTLDGFDIHGRPVDVQSDPYLNQYNNLLEDHALIEYVCQVL